MNEQIKLFIFFTFLLAILVSARFMTVYGQTSSSTINAQVKISICGNTLIEGGEDCEGSDLNDKTCSSLGYSSGNLSCDVACTFDTYACIVPTSTPTPPSAPTNTPTPSPTTTKTPTPTPTNTLTSSPTLSLTKSIFPSATPTLLPPTPGNISPTPLPLPNELKIFDITGSGKISKITLAEVVQLWVNDWKLFMTANIGETPNSSSQPTDDQTCDINRDKVCDIRDFSVLMYYIER